MSGFEWLCLIGFAVYAVHQWERYQEDKAAQAAALEEFRRDEWRS